MRSVASTEGICPLQWKLAFKRTTEQQQVQPKYGRSDTNADAVETLNFSGIERPLRLFNATITSDYFNKILFL
jgi:hypothetical protein